MALTGQQLHVAPHRRIKRHGRDDHRDHHENIDAPTPAVVCG
ncbi:MAG: hypothetical protein M5R36_16240 [Deltaproteobacteria bacterium]|nr:hypothetical protein [Deltaproteobacteria bacterium]